MTPTTLEHLFSGQFWVSTGYWAWMADTGLPDPYIFLKAQWREDARGTQICIFTFTYERDREIQHRFLGARVSNVSCFLFPYKASSCPCKFHTEMDPSFTSFSIICSIAPWGRPPSRQTYFWTQRHVSPNIFTYEVYSICKALSTGIISFELQGSLLR